MESPLRQTGVSAISVRDPGDKRRGARGVARSHRSLGHGFFPRCSQTIWLRARRRNAVVSSSGADSGSGLRHARRAHATADALPRRGRPPKRRRSLPRQGRPYEPRSVRGLIPTLAKLRPLHRPENVVIVLAACYRGGMTMPIRFSTPRVTSMQKIVVLGATSGIALEVQRQLARRGCKLLLVARSPERLAALQYDLIARGAREVLVCAADLASIPQHAGIFDFVQRSFPGFDTVLLAYGSMHDQKDSEASIDILLEELNVNFVSASAILTLFAAVPSVAGDRGRRSNYVYGSAKGALSLFLQGLRSRLHPAGVKVITIKPGPVQTPMTDHLPNASRFAEPEVVARDIVRALDRRSPDVLYTPKIWRFIMTAVEHIP